MERLQYKNRHTFALLEEEEEEEAESFSSCNSQ